MGKPTKLEQRFKLLFIPDYVILQMIRGWWVKGIDKQVITLPDISKCLPKDAFLVSVEHACDIQSFIFKIYSNTFDVVPCLARIPAIVENVDYHFRTYEIPINDAPEIKKRD